MKTRSVGRVSHFLFGFVLFVLSGGRVSCQVPATSVNGIVTDPNHALVSNAHVTAVNDATSVSRETVTNGDGVYSLPDLPPGTYTIRIEASGFAVSEFKSVQLETGRATTLDVGLVLASVGTTVNVTSGTISVELTQSMIQGQITSSTIQNIPLNGRNFLELAYLVPGNRPAPNFDPTKTNTLEVSSAGGFGRGGNITVDGGDNNDEVVGGTLANFPQDSVQEFQIATGRFTAEVGRSGNSIINIVTKSGANDYHGSAFFYERNRNLQARPATLAASEPTPPFDRQQYGGSIGGPIIKDKTFWFASAEYRHQNSSIETGERNFATQSIVNTSAPAPLRDFLLSTHVDHQLNASNRLSARYSFNRSTDTAAAEPAQPTPQSSASERQNSLNRFNSVIGEWTSTLSPSKVNSLIFHFDTFLNSIPPYPGAAPTTDVPGLAATNELIFPDLADGVNFNTPQSTHLNRYQVRDSFAWNLGKHNLHLGAEYQHYNAFGEINVFGSGSIILPTDFPIFNLSGSGAPCAMPGVTCTDEDIPIAVSIKSNAPVKPVPIPPIPNSYIAGYVQDDWRVTHKLTFNLGLRWEYDTDLTGTGTGHGPCPSLTVQPTEPCLWMANVIDLHRTTDKKDFGPRVGFAYDPFGHGRTVIRGGYGIYYDRIILEVPGYERVQDDRALTVNEYAGSECALPGVPGASFNECFAPGATFAPGSPTLANPFSGPAQTGGVGIIVVAPGTHHPLFQQTSLGVQQQLGGNWLLSTDGLHVFGQRQIIAQFLRNTTSTSPYIACPGQNIPCTVTDPLNGVSDNVTEATSNGKSWYDGLLVSLEHKPVRVGPLTYFFNASYTLSKTLDYSDDDQTPSYTTVENVNLVEGTSGIGLEKGYAASDERHRLTVYGNIQMPWGFSLSPLYTYGSGIPADTYIAGLSEANIPGATISARLPLLSRNAIGREIKNSAQLNAVIAKWNALPLCPAPAPCNSGVQIQPVPNGINFTSPFNSLDSRLVKAIRLTERQHLDLIAEVFNLFNNVNVRGFNNSNYSGRNIALYPVGTNATPSNAVGVDSTFYQAVSTAGGFFGSGGPRAFQFSARYTF
jgi:Carboxypeptidase regulatory-like domain/TonB dependent receptor